jgi:acetolactate synthase-1/2/3 large subunit
MMLNLQELQTIVHHQLPIKIIVFSNDGYLMIKKTQQNAGQILTASNAASGVSCPSFVAMAQAFGIQSAEIRTRDHFKRVIPQLFYARGPMLVEYHMDPDQMLVPKLGYKTVDGKNVYDRFDQMSPCYVG